jgi:hypothetical protein
MTLSSVASDFTIFLMSELEPKGGKCRVEENKETKMDWRTPEDGILPRICFHMLWYGRESMCCCTLDRQTAKKDGCEGLDDKVEGNAPTFTSFPSR